MPIVTDSGNKINIFLNIHGVKKCGGNFFQEKVSPTPLSKTFSGRVRDYLYFTMKQVAISCVIFVPRSMMRLKTAFSHAPWAQ